MIEGLQIFEKVERMIEQIEFLQSQSNLLGAANEFYNLRKYVIEPEIKQVLMEYGVIE